MLAGTALALAAALLAGCGKKPASLQPPQGKENDRFPGFYPNPAFDPQPGKAPAKTPEKQAPQPGGVMAPRPGEIPSDRTSPVLPQ
jgi:hypothetical protein